MNSLDLALNEYIAIRRALGFELREVAGCLRNFVAFLKIFCFSDTCLDGHQVAAIFWKQGSHPLRVTDAHMDRDDSPAIRHES